MLIPVALAIGWLARGAIEGKSIAHDDAPKRREFREKSSGLTNPLLDCEVADGLENRELVPIQGRIEEAVAKVRAAGLAVHVSVYYRDLNNGPWFGVDEDASFSPASLLKVATLIALYKEGEARPGVLDRKVVYPGGKNEAWTQNVEPPPPMVAGQAYSLDELAERMIVYSDNTASDLIKASLDPGALQRAFEDLGIPFPSTGRTDFMSVKEYASFFRILYNASYLGRPMSERALDLLTRSKYEHGLRAAIPADIRIAHKFGERGYQATESAVKMTQLHDCGIVYLPGRPYLLCIMTRGERTEGLAAAIREVAKAVHEDLVRLRG